MLDLQSWLLLLETARALSGPSQSMAGQTTIREILCLPETVTGRAFDLELRLDDLDLTPRVSTPVLSQERYHMCHAFMCNMNRQLSPC